VSFSGILLVNVFLGIVNNAIYTIARDNFARKTGIEADVF